MQYFERNRLEYHPELPRAFQVSLGLFGAEVLSSQGRGPAKDTSQLITSKAIGRPVAAGRYLLWVEKHTGSNSIMAYNLGTRRTDLVASSLGHPNLASDGQTLVWSGDTGQGGGIMAYDLASKRLSTITSVDQTAVQDLAMDAGVIYHSYPEGLKGRYGSGVHSHNLATGAEQLVSNSGQEPVAADGKVLWVERVQLPCSPTYPDPQTGETGQWCPWDWDLHMFSNGSDKTIANSYAEDEFDGYHISGNKIVFSRFAGSAIVHNIVGGTDQDISGKPVMNPLISGNTVVWTIPHLQPGGMTYVSSIEVVDLGGKITPETIVKDSPGQIVAQAIAQHKWLVFTVKAGPSQDEQELRITSLDSRDLTITGIGGK